MKRLLFAAACLVMVPSRGTLARQGQVPSRWRIHGGVALMATDEPMGRESSQPFLQYELGATVNLGAHLYLSSAVLYLHGLLDARPYRRDIMLVNAGTVADGGSTVSPNDGIALGLSAKKAFGRRRLRPYVGLNAFYASNRTSPDGVFVGMRLGASYVVTRRWDVGVEGQWNGRSTGGGDIWQLGGLGLVSGYGL